MHVAIVGCGPAGLFLGSALARRGHRVTAVDRDAGPTDASSWPRRGVMQFHHAHGFRRPVGDALQREVPEAYDAWLALGAEPVLAEVPGAGTQQIGHWSRRETFERALRATAESVPGLTLQRGHVDAVVVERGRAAGIRVDGRILPADLVIDASGRSGRISRGLGERAGLGGPCGQAYVDRVYRLRPGADPGPMSNPVAWQADFDSYLSMVFRHERGIFSVLIVRAANDQELKALRHEAAFDAATRSIPGLDAWTDPRHAEPLTGVLPGGALLNVYRGQTSTDGRLVLPGLVFVGDSVATTTPRFGRGVTTTLMQATALLDLFDEAADLESTSLAFHAWCEQQMKPWVVDHVDMDGAQDARWRGADVDLDAPLPSDLILAAAEVRPEIMASAGGYLSMAAPPASLRAAEPTAREVYAGGWRPAYAPVPSRDELAAIVADALAQPA